jgi:hypothetical protein
MITLTLQCSRCSKEVSHDMTNQTINDDLVRKFGFSYLHDGKTNVLICNECENLYKELQGRLDNIVKSEVCGFFDNCGKEKENGYRSREKNGRS